ncbi:uncharacterized protein HD556DRAFT_300380 [Suillus plorans]|uniref:Uncharacterized protein n=1 Tax=Suillus plorans TaxID=116603 RepID=A0A9P7ATK2_9AGAM|nr:uncharacterized protein HD556DRAFT_300380 [Suillus plorans]KAG1796407.1 hypothetical protein HD556DRAFT_300380 [Suillus plorans]
MPRATPSQAQQAPPQDTQTPSTSTMQTFWNTSHTRRPLSIAYPSSFCNVYSEKAGVDMHWISEFGILNVFLLPGPVPTDIFTRYAHLTGTAPLPEATETS